MSGVEEIEKPLVKGAASPLFSIIEEEEGDDEPGHPVGVHEEHIEPLGESFGGSAVYDEEEEEAVGEIKECLLYPALPEEICDEDQGKDLKPALQIEHCSEAEWNSRKAQTYP